jgi:prevent-host-death family protein
MAATERVTDLPESIGLYDAKTQLSRIAERVEATGEEVIITRNGKPILRVIRYTEEPVKRTSGRSVSFDVGDTWDTPELNAEIADDFYAGGEL